MGKPWVQVLVNREWLTRGFPGGFPRGFPRESPYNHHFMARLIAKLLRKFPIGKNYDTPT